MSMIAKSFRWMAPGGSSGSCTPVWRWPDVLGTGAAVCWVAGRGSRGCAMTVVDLPRRPQTVVDLPTSRRRVAGVHRPPSRRRHRRWSTGPRGAARRRRLAVMAGPADPAHDQRCQVGDDPRVASWRARPGSAGGAGARPSGWDRRGRSGCRRCRGRDGGRCTPATRRRDVGRSTTVWGLRGRSTTVIATRRPSGVRAGRSAAGIAGPSTLVTIPTSSTNATT